MTLSRFSSVAPIVLFVLLVLSVPLVTQAAGVAQPYSVTTNIPDPSGRIVGTKTVVVTPTYEDWLANPTTFNNTVANPCEIANGSPCSSAQLREFFDTEKVTPIPLDPRDYAYDLNTGNDSAWTTPPCSYPGSGNDSNLAPCDETNNTNTGTDGFLWPSQYPPPFRGSIMNLEPIGPEQVGGPTSDDAGPGQIGDYRLELIAKNCQEGEGRSDADTLELCMNRSVQFWQGGSLSGEDAVRVRDYIQSQDVPQADDSNTLQPVVTPENSSPGIWDRFTTWLGFDDDFEPQETIASESSTDELVGTAGEREQFVPNVQTGGMQVTQFGVDAGVADSAVGQAWVGGIPDEQGEVQQEDAVTSGNASVSGEAEGGELIASGESRPWWERAYDSVADKMSDWF